MKPNSTATASRIIAVELPAEVAAALERIARTHGATVEAVCRKALTQYAAQNIERQPEA